MPCENGNLLRRRNHSAKLGIGARKNGEPAVRLAATMSETASKDTAVNSGETVPTRSDAPKDDSPQDEGVYDTPSFEAIVEAVLFASDAPLPARRIAMIAGQGGAAEVRQTVEALNEKYERVGASFRIESIANGFQMLTMPTFNEFLARLKKTRAETKLSAAALETLAIVAYRQPVIRADIEAIRGVAVGDVLVRLRDMKLVKIVGRAEEVGRPLLYGTTTQFLEVFGLRSLDDLPTVDSSTPDGVPKLRLARNAEDETATPDDGSADSDAQPLH